MTTPATLTDAVLDAAVDWTRPMLTYYHEGTGERTELSATTLANWAAKSANHLLDEIGLTPGETVRVDLPEHWQTAAILLGAWWAGARVVIGPADDETGEAAVYTCADRIDDHPDADEVFVASLDAFAMPLTDLPPGISDYAASVRVHGDQYRSRPYTGAVLEDLPADAIIAEASVAAAGIGSGDRVLSTREWHTRDGVVAHLLAPLLAGAGLVQVVGGEETRIAAIAGTEKADHLLR